MFEGYITYNFTQVVKQNLTLMPVKNVYYW